MPSQIARASALDLLEIAIFLAIVVADGFGLVPITQTIWLVPLIGLTLWLRKEPWRSIGFARPASWGKAIALGVVAGVALELLAVYVTTPFIARLFDRQPDYSEFAGIRGNVGQLVFFLVFSWIVAAFGEEICFRGFLMKRLARLFGETPAAWWVALILSSVLFGWGHTEQGVSGWIQEGLSGFLLGVLFLASGRNLTVPIVAHGVSNSVAFVLIYFGRYPGAS
jgi:membrane protease YdiL (CAAX protease family)